MGELETKSMWEERNKEDLGLPAYKVCSKSDFREEKKLLFAQRILADEKSIFRTFFFGENGIKKGAEFSAPFLISVFFENYLLMVCSLSGPTETTFTGISSSFSIKSI
mgnify:CR=1 FL=1